MRKLSKLICAVACAMALFTVGTAPPANALLLVDRGLPDINLNNAAGPDRSNVAWDDGTLGWSIGDTFTLSSKSYVDDIRLWIIPADTVSELAVLYSTLDFYLGPNPALDGTIPLSMSTTLSGNSATNPSITITPATYTGGVGYQGTSGTYHPMYQVDLALDQTLNAGTYAFTMDGEGAGDVNNNLFLLASNAALSGTPQDGADGLLLDFEDNVSSTARLDNIFNSNGNGWDKSSDTNVQVYGKVPEPPALALFLTALVGFAGLGALKRRRTTT